MINLNETNAVTFTDIDTFNGPITIDAGGTITATDVASLTDNDANDISITTTAATSRSARSSLARPAMCS